MPRPTIEPSEIYVAPNQPSPSSIRSMPPSAATQLLNQQRKMVAAKQQQLQQQQQQKRQSAPSGSTIVSQNALSKPPVGATVINNPVTPVGNQSLLQLQQQGIVPRSNLLAQGARTSIGAPRLSIVDNPNYVPSRKSPAIPGNYPGNNGSTNPRSPSIAIATPRFGMISGNAATAATVLPTGVLGVPSSGMIGVVTPTGLATIVPAMSIPQSVRSDKFIASQVLKNQATLQKQANTATVKGMVSSKPLSDGSDAINMAPIFVSNTGAVIAVPSGGGIMTPMITSSLNDPTVTAVTPSVSVLIPQPPQKSPSNASQTSPPSSYPTKTLPREVVKNILTKKYVTPYKPREMPSSVVKDKMASGLLPGGAGPFSCTDCGDIFWMRSSYENHR